MIRRYVFIFPIILLHFVASAQNVDTTAIHQQVYYDAEQQMLKEEFFLKDKKSGVIVGPYRQYFQNGKLASEITYLDGNPTGLAKYFFESGNIKMEGQLVDGVSEGLWVYYYENGQKSMSGKLRNGVREGEWIFYFENGRMKSKGNFQEGKREGIWNYFYEDGQLKAQAAYENGAGTYQEFYNTGKLKMEGKNDQGKSVGVWKFYYETGELEATGLYENGTKNGLWKYFHKNENLSATGYYKDGKKDGRWSYFYEDGQISAEGEEQLGIKEGFWKLYYESGAVKGETTYNKGEGTYSEYYETGHLKVRGNIENEQYVGGWQYFTESGKLEGEAIYVDGFGTYRGFYPDGTLKMEGQLKNEKRIGEWKLYNTDGSLAGTYQPIYEEEDPIYFTKKTLTAKSEKVDYAKPAYRFKNRNSKYFTQRINEYQGLIASIDPFSLYFGRLTGGLEFYFQERLGYEILATLHRDPFFSRHTNVPLNTSFSLGATVKIRQKLYSSDGDLGMFYFGHEVGYSLLEHSARVIDSLSVSVERNIRIQESRWQYGLFIGNRWMQRSGDSGFTVDIYGGIGWVNRTQNRNFPQIPEYDRIFSDIDTKRNFFPFLFGVQIGYAASKRRSKN